MVTSTHKTNKIKKVSRAFLNFEEAANTLKVTSKSSDEKNNNKKPVHQSHIWDLSVQVSSSSPPGDPSLFVTIRDRRHCPTPSWPPSGHSVNEESKLCMAPVSFLIKTSYKPSIGEVLQNNGGCKHFFPPVAAEYCWGVINLHSLAQDKEPINWKELLKDEDRGAVTEQQLLGLDSTNAPARRRPKFFFFFPLVIYNLSWQVQIWGWWRWMQSCVLCTFRFRAQCAALFTRRDNVQR